MLIEIQMQDINILHAPIQYSLIILGGLMFSIYFWNRFLRARTPKFLPLNLNVLGFFILLYICLIFLYITISLIKSKDKNPALEKIIDTLFTPIFEFDCYLKSFSFIGTLFDKFIEFSISYLKYFIIDTYLFFIIFWLFPRLILLTALFIDVFGNYQLYYKYQVLLFGLLLLFFFNRYFRYCLKSYKSTLQNQLNFVVDGINTN
jgi:hypothetical protein